MNTQAVEQLAHELRGAITRIPSALLPCSMSRFPSGACGDTSLLLGAYLTDNGFQGFNYVCGERGTHADGTWTSHAWLAKEELVVDITADQFEDAPTGVIVQAPSIWHKSFTTESLAPADFREYSGSSIPALAALYERLRPFLFGA